MHHLEGTPIQLTLDPRYFEHFILYLFLLCSRRVCTYSDQRSAMINKLWNAVSLFQLLCRKISTKIFTKVVAPSLQLDKFVLETKYELLAKLFHPLFFIIFIRQRIRWLSPLSTVLQNCKQQWYLYSIIKELAESLSCPPPLDTRLITLFSVTYLYHVGFLRVHIRFQTNSKITYYSQCNCLSCIKNRCKIAHVRNNCRRETGPLLWEIP